MFEANGARAVHVHPNGLGENPDFVKVDHTHPNGPRLSLGGTPWHFCGANCYYLMVSNSS